MAKKNKLEHVNANANAMIGISTALRDYRLAHYLNQGLNITLTVQEDLPVYSTKSDSLNLFPFFTFHHLDLRTDFCLIANFNGALYLIPTLKQLDYILLLQGCANDQHIEDIILLLRRIQGIQAALRIDQSKVKELGGILEDLELHKIEILRNNKQNSVPPLS